MGVWHGVGGVRIGYVLCVFVCVSVGGWVSEWVGVGVQMPVCVLWLYTCSHLTLIQCLVLVFSGY